MSWGGWGRGRRGGWIGPWPGRGPFSYLPPWQRPGWLFGRGACWWLFGNPWWAFYINPYYTWYNPLMQYWYGPYPLYRPLPSPYYAPYYYPFY